MQTICLIILLLGLPGCGAHKSISYRGINLTLSNSTKNYKEQYLKSTVDNVYEKFNSFWHLENDTFDKYIRGTEVTAEDCYCFQRDTYQPIDSIDKCRIGVDHRSLIWLDTGEIKLAVLYREGTPDSWITNLLTHELGHLILDKLGVPSNQHQEYMELIGLE